MPARSELLRCPACNARLRGALECSRCGADLSSLLALAAEAFELQLACWRALERGEASLAVAYARAAQETRTCESFAATALLCELLAEVYPSPGADIPQRYDRD